MVPGFSVIGLVAARQWRELWIKAGAMGTPKSKASLKAPDSNF
jgi:hypothetical protein